MLLLLGDSMTNKPGSRASVFRPTFIIILSGITVVGIFVYFIWLNILSNIPVNPDDRQKILLQGITLTFSALALLGLSTTFGFGIKSYEKTQKDINLILKNDNMRNLPIDGQIICEIMEKDTIPFLVISVEGSLTENTTLKSATIVELRTKYIGDFGRSTSVANKKRHTLTQSIELTPINYGKDTIRGKKIIGIIPGPEKLENVDMYISATVSNGYRSDLLTKTGELYYDYKETGELKFSYPQGTMWDGLPGVTRDMSLYMEENYVHPPVQELQVSDIPIDLRGEVYEVLGEARLKLYICNLSNTNIRLTKCEISVKSPLYDTEGNKTNVHNYFLKAHKYIPPGASLLILSTDVQIGTFSINLDVSNSEITRNFDRGGEFDLSKIGSEIQWEADEYTANSQLRDTFQLFEYMDMITDETQLNPTS